MRTRFAPASAGVFFLVDLDNIMPTASPSGGALSTQDRLDAAVAAMLRAGVFLVRRPLLMCDRMQTDEGTEADDNVCRPHQDALQDDVHPTREADAGESRDARPGSDCCLKLCFFRLCFAESRRRLDYRSGLDPVIARQMRGERVHTVVCMYR